MGEDAQQRKRHRRSGQKGSEPLGQVFHMTSLMRCSGLPVAALGHDLGQACVPAWQRLTFLERSSHLLGLTVGPPRRHRQIHLSSTNHSTSARRAERYALAHLEDAGITGRAMASTRRRQPAEHPDRDRL
jgi:hypothetical protein